MSKEQIMPSNIKAREADVIKAGIIIKDEKNYIVRYLRNAPTVGLASIPVRNAEDGAIILDADPIRRRVICAGIPYGCMIAFMYANQLRIGWSKRIEIKQFVESSNLHNLFHSVLDSAGDITEENGNYQEAFELFSAALSRFITIQQPKETEIAFSKLSGKTAAIIRGLNDTIAFTNSNYVTSTASGPIPQDVARNLRWFISQAESIYDGKAANVSYPDQELAIAPGTLPAV